jgi:hypothetical protein
MWRIILKDILEELGCEVLDWIQVAEDRVHHLFENFRHRIYLTEYSESVT